MPPPALRPHSLAVNRKVGKMSRSTRNQWFSRFQKLIRRPRKSRPLSRSMMFEQLGARITPAVSAFFIPSAGVLSIIGDNLDNTVAVSRDAAGTLRVNGGAVSV